MPKAFSKNDFTKGMNVMLSDIKNEFKAGKTNITVKLRYWDTFNIIITMILDYLGRFYVPEKITFHIPKQIVYYNSSDLNKYELLREALVTIYKQLSKYVQLNFYFETNNIIDVTKYGLPKPIDVLQHGTSFVYVYVKKQTRKRQRRVSRRRTSRRRTRRRSNKKR